MGVDKTKSIKIPVSLIPAVKALINLHEESRSSIDIAEVIYSMHQAGIYGFNSIKELNKGSKDLHKKIDEMERHLEIDAPEWDKIENLREKAKAWSS